MKAIRSRCVCVFLCTMSYLFTTAAVRLPSLISDNMVLQQKSKVALWGWADAGEQVTITTSWNNKTEKITAGASGKWLVYVATTKAGGPYKITFIASNTVQVSNILLGEVWLASGQSNMEFFVGKTRSSSYTGVIDYEQEIKAANFPAIRQIDVANKNAGEPQTDFKGNWKVCSPQTVDTFSAVAYYFARKIYQETGYPVGIINSTWGGTAIESWTKKEVLASDSDLNKILDNYTKSVQDYPNAKAKYETDIAKWKQDTVGTAARGEKPKAAPAKPMDPVTNSKSPSKLYNAMIHPLVPYTFKGALWYQGESNAGRAYQYRKLFPAMIDSWRDEWKNDFPFYFVQIAPHYGQNPEIRDAQLLTFLTKKKTGMAVITDAGDSLDIHPRNKQVVGHRLALWALAKDYKQKSVVYSGPIYKKMKVVGNKIKLIFNNVDGGLVAKDGDLKEFTIAGADQKFMPAQAVIEGNSIIVWSTTLASPVAVRFAWKTFPRPNLYNSAGLPASPFRTDSWKGETEGKN